MPHAFSRKAILAAAGVAVLALVGSIFLLSRGGGGPAGPEDEEAETPERANLAAFRDRTREAGITFRMSFLPQEQGEQFKINLYDHGCGVAVVDDLDGKGRAGLYFLNQLGPNALYRSNGDGTFTDVTRTAGVGLGDRVCVGAAWADTRNNGLQDLYVTSTRGGNVFYRNNGDGTFTDATRKAGLTHVGHSQTAVFFDFDNDGFLDLFVTNTARWTTPVYDRVDHYFLGPSSFAQLCASPHESNILYRNNGNGTFTDVTAKAGVAGKGWGGDAAVFDYNDDGHLDLYVTNMFGANQLYRNNGDGTFTDVTREVLGRTSFGATGCKAFDFNNDGRLDLFVVDMHSDMWLRASIDPATAAASHSLTKKYPHIMGPAFDTDPDGQRSERLLVDIVKLRYDDVVFGNTLFKQQPSGKFVEVSDRAGMETFWPWGIATGDFDNDGLEDVFIPSGMGYPFGYWPNALMMNNGNETFTDRAAALGIEPPRGGKFLREKFGDRRPTRSSRCAAVLPGDHFKDDGRLDLVVNNFNDRPYYFRNYFPAKHWVAFQLTGARRGRESEGSNRDAIGALVRIHVGKEVMIRQVHGAGGYLSQSSRVIHFGLGDRARIDRVEVRWPGVRTWQEVKAPAINSLNKITQPVP